MVAVDYHYFFSMPKRVLHAVLGGEEVVISNVYVWCKALQREGTSRDWHHCLTQHRPAPEVLRDHYKTILPQGCNALFGGVCLNQPPQNLAHPLALRRRVDQKQTLLMFTCCTTALTVEDKT